jgi:hypothetical protein
MISQGCPPVTSFRTQLRRSGPHLSISLKNEFPLAHPYPSSVRRVAAHSSAPLPPPLVVPCAHPRHLCRLLPCCSSIYPSPIAVTHAADPAMAAREHVSWRLKSSRAKPRAPTSANGAGGARVSWLTVSSDPNGWNRLARPSPPLYYICMFQVF